MKTIQIILLFFFAFAVFKAFFRFRNRDISWWKFLFWIVFWLAAAAVVIWPDSTFYFSNKLGIGRGADLIVYLALAIIFFLIFRLTALLEKQKREITELTRAIALKKERPDEKNGNF